MDPYLIVKWIHILSSTILFGAGVGTALQMVLAHRGGDVAVIAGVTRNIVIADWLTVVPSGVVQPLSGLFLIHLAGFEPWAPWLVASYLLYGIAGVCWLVVVRLQLQMRDLSRDAADRGRALPAAYHARFRLWFILGWPGFLSLVGIYALMVIKPG